MKRPLAVTGFSYVAACMLLAALPPRVWLAAGAALGVCGLLALLSRHWARGYAVCMLLATGCACMTLLLAFEMRLVPALADAGALLPLSGMVTDVRGPRSIEVRRTDGITVAVSAREALDARPGETFSASVSYSRYEDAASTASARLKAKQVPLRGFVVGEYHVESPMQGTPAAVLFSVRERLSDALLTLLPGESGAVLSAMLLGETWRMPQELRDAYSAAGIAHLLSISGYHVALLAGLLQAVLRPVRLGRRASILLTCLAILFYMALVPFRPGVIRAGVMLLLTLLASLLGREADTITSLAASGLILCVYDPFMATQTSFCLSFLATLGLVLFTGRLKAWMEGALGEARHPKVRGFLLETLCATLCASAATLPVLLLQFDRIPLYAVLTNLAVAPLVPIAMACGVLTAVLGAIPGVRLLAVPLAFAAGAAMDTMNAVVRLIAKLPFAQPPAGAGFLPLWMAGCAVLVAAAFVKPTRKKTAACALLCGITLMAGALSYQLMMRGAVRLTVVATERSAAIVAIKDRCAVLLGDIRTNSDAYDVGRVLERYPIDRLELVALTPGSGTRSGAVGTLLAGYEVGLAVLGEADHEDARMEASLPGAKLCPWEEPMEMAFLNGDGARLAEGSMFAEFEDIKTFILGGECDILNSMLKEGRPVVAILGDARPAEVQRLRCDFLVDCGSAGVPGAAGTAVTLAEPGDAAAFLIKDGRIRLLEAETDYSNLR